MNVRAVLQSFGKRVSQELQRTVAFAECGRSPRTSIRQRAAMLWLRRLLQLVRKYPRTVVIAGVRRGLRQPAAIGWKTPAQS